MVAGEQFCRYIAVGFSSLALLFNILAIFLPSMLVATKGLATWTIGVSVAMGCKMEGESCNYWHIPQAMENKPRAKSQNSNKAPSSGRLMGGHEIFALFTALMSLIGLGILIFDVFKPSKFFAFLSSAIHFTAMLCTIGAVMFILLECDWTSSSMIYVQSKNYVDDNVFVKPGFAFVALILGGVGELFATATSIGTKVMFEDRSQNASGFAEDMYEMRHAMCGGDKEEDKEDDDAEREDNEGSGGKS